MKCELNYLHPPQQNVTCSARQHIPKLPLMSCGPTKEQTRVLLNCCLLFFFHLVSMAFKWANQVHDSWAESAAGVICSTENRHCVTFNSQYKQLVHTFEHCQKVPKAYKFNKGHVIFKPSNELRQVSTT